MHFYHIGKIYAYSKSYIKLFRTYIIAYPSRFVNHKFKFIRDKISVVSNHLITYPKP